MKNKILFFLTLFVCSLSAQVPTLEDLPRSIKREYRQDLRQAKRDLKEYKKEDWDILPDPIETPVEIPKSFFDPGSLNIVSWQTQLQRMPELEQRIKTECIYPVHYKISDSGVDQTHTDLQAGFTGEYDWTGEGHNPGTHGTAMAGVVVSFMYPLIETGVVTYDDQKTLRAAGNGSFAWPANMFLNNLQDVEQRTENGETVVYNCSWGGGTSIIESVEVQLKKTVEAGGIIVAAAGNDGGPVGYIAKSPYVWAISSIDQNMTISSFSNRGPEIAGTSGGRNIYTTLPNNNYGLTTGTSPASAGFASIFIGYACAKWGPQRLPDYDALYAYYKKIAVQIGNGDPELYGFGYPYIETILNTEPDGGVPDPDPEPDPEPEPPSDDLYYVSGIETSGHIMRWRYENENAWRLLYVPIIEWEALGEDGENETYAIANEFIKNYFLNRGMVMPPEMDSYSATWWTGQFLEYVANNAGLAIDVTLLTAQDEKGTYQARNFDKAGAAFLQLMMGVELIDL